MLEQIGEEKEAYLPPAALPDRAPAESTASAPAAPQPSVLSSGSFVSGEHPTQSTVRITAQGGQRTLELDQAFATSTSGPDLVVILHRSPDAALKAAA